MAENQTMIVYEKIKNKIESGEYSPAQSLTESALAEEYSVSRNTIKKALLMLENDAYVSIGLNKGAKVRSYSKSEVIQFLELREVLEGFIVRLTVPEITDKQIEKLRKILEQMKEFKESNDLMSYSACNKKFHTIIYEACPNKPAVEMTLKLKNQMRKYNSKTILIPGRADLSLEEHRNIYNSIKSRDVSKAEVALCTHIKNVREIFEQYYSLLL